jgi:2-hydroxy-3-keto-5-methylthiopentenyl-1-phosphate phosphatase
MCYLFLIGSLYRLSLLLYISTNVRLNDFYKRNVKKIAENRINYLVMSVIMLIFVVT